MPSGVYIREKAISSIFKKGRVPHNKGVKTSRVLKKIESLKLGLPIECVNHGFHHEWRIHSGNNVKCKKCEKETQKRDRDLNPIKYLLRDAKTHAKAKKIAFDINENYVLSILKAQNYRCALSGISFDVEKMSLDRINSSLGYIKGNVQLLTIGVNVMKSNFDQDYFIGVCKRIAENNL